MIDLRRGSANTVDAGGGAGALVEAGGIAYDTGLDGVLESLTPNVQWSYGKMYSVLGGGVVLGGGATAGTVTGVVYGTQSGKSLQSEPETELAKRANEPPPVVQVSNGPRVSYAQFLTIHESTAVQRGEHCGVST